MRNWAASARRNTLHWICGFRQEFENEKTVLHQALAETEYGPAGTDCRWVGTP